MLVSVDALSSCNSGIELRLQLSHFRLKRHQLLKNQPLKSQPRKSQLLKSQSLKSQLLKSQLLQKVERLKVLDQTLQFTLEEEPS